MALNWNVAAIEAREGTDYVWPMEGTTEESRRLRGSLDCLIWATMFVGMPGITADNWPTFAARLRAWERAVGPISTSRKPQTVEAVRRAVGLSTNASTLTLAAFERALGKAALAEAKRQTEAEAEAEPTAAAPVPAQIAQEAQA